MKIAFFETEKWQEVYLKEKLKKIKGKHEFKFFQNELDVSYARKIKDFDAVVVFVYSEVTQKVLEQFKDLKAVFTNSTGFDHIDINYCKAKGIKVCNVPKYGENTVAEQTFGLILSLSRKIPEAVERTKKGNFSNDGLMGFDLKGKKLGVVGVGNIGQHVVKIGNGFGMEVLGYDYKKDLKKAKKFGYKSVSLSKLLNDSDILTLHVPYNKNTHHIVGKEQFAIMKKGVYLVNTARGGLVDGRELIKALDKEIVAGAGLDVLEDEDLFLPGEDLLSKKLSVEESESIVENNILFKKKNVIITPHNSFNTREAIQRILDTTVDNINSLNKKCLSNCVC